MYKNGYREGGGEGDAYETAKQCFFFFFSLDSYTTAELASGEERKKKKKKNVSRASRFLFSSIRSVQQADNR